MMAYLDWDITVTLHPWDVLPEAVRLRAVEALVKRYWDGQLQWAMLTGSWGRPCGFDGLRGLRLSDFDGDEV